MTRTAWTPRGSADDGIGGRRILAAARECVSLLANFDLGFG